MRLSVPRVDLETLAIADLVHDQDGATRPRPDYSHVLKFELRFGSVMTVNNHDSWHFLARLSGNIEIRRRPKPGAALIHNVLAPIAFTQELRGHSYLQGTALREYTHRIPESFQPSIAKVVPVGQRLYLVPVALFVFQNL